MFIVVVVVVVDGDGRKGDLIWLGLKFLNFGDRRGGRERICRGTKEVQDCRR